MSSLVSKKRKKVPAPVIVRGFQAEPAHLTAIGWRSNGVIDVVGADEADPAGFHAEDVYDFNKAFFGRLRAAFDAGEPDDLESLWSQGTTWAS